MRRISVSLLRRYAAFRLHSHPVQLAGNKDPFTVTVILACVQLLSVLISALTTDTFGRRPMTVYGYAVTVVAVLCLGIVGCFDYTSPQLGSLLVRPLRLGVDLIPAWQTADARSSSLASRPFQPPPPRPSDTPTWRKFPHSGSGRGWRDCPCPSRTSSPSCSPSPCL